MLSKYRSIKILIILKLFLKEKLLHLFLMTESRLQQKDIRCLLLSIQQLHAAESVSESGLWIIT